ncbi:helix-turn-helix domain-containing protein [Pseudalkalibacillus decolorationis]|uniref:helix-turn-helix domain-containing protein n=1 Tax=Pseudalkalibacillus decolorationis TaxID=163879 RepID=UPI0021485C44|nr:helix-turn-helix domain-containing protein [Pseudalkalibacillus decolorationis]
MTKLLIADRDQNERTGISWLVSSYSIPFQKVMLTDSISEVFQLIENEVPEVVCIELDMIPKDTWDLFKELMKQYEPTIIVMTAEATFERALQGIQLHANDIWVKPQSPDNIKRVLNECYRTISKTNHETGQTPEPSTTPLISYRSLFLNQGETSENFRLMLMQLEHPTKNPVLLTFLNEYPFHIPPILLPLSDMIVCVFAFKNHQPLQHLKHLGNRILMNWEEKHSEPMSIVIYDTDDPLLSLNQKYLHAKQALEIHFFKGYRQVSVIEGKVDWVTIDPFLTPSEQRTWIEMLNYADREQIKEWMYKEFLNKGEPYPEPGLLRTRLTSLLAQVRRFMKSLYLDEGQLEEYYHRVFETILYNPILYRIVQDFLLFIYEVLVKAKIHRENARTDIIEQAIQYMERNFHNPELRLEDVASFVERSPAYFSSLLTKHGNSFKQLLTSIRIKEAEHLLLETKRSVQEVAEKAGFLNANYFSRIFKEKTGATPSSFRNRK